MYFVTTLLGRFGQSDPSFQNLYLYPIRPIPSSPTVVQLFSSVLKETPLIVFSDWHFFFCWSFFNFLGSFGCRKTGWRKEVEKTLQGINFYCTFFTISPQRKRPLGHSAGKGHFRAFYFLKMISLCREWNWASCIFHRKFVLPPVIPCFPPSCGASRWPTLAEGNSFKVNKDQNSLLKEF